MFDFDKKIERAGTASVKYDMRQEIFGKADVLPMWVADMDFEAPACIRKAIVERVSHPVYGYSIMTDAYFEAFMGWVSRRHNWLLEKEWIVFSPGIVTAINAAVFAFTSQKTAWWCSRRFIFRFSMPLKTMDANSFKISCSIWIILITSILMIWHKKLKRPN